MKKLIYIFIGLLLLTSCNSKTSKTPQNSGRQHIFHTYYGYIDTDSMEAAGLDIDGYECYVVCYKGIDTICYYVPAKNSYFVQIPINDEHGNITVDYDPQTDNW